MDVDVPSSPHPAERALAGSSASISPESNLDLISTLFEGGRALHKPAHHQHALGIATVSDSHGTAKQHLHQLSVMFALIGRDVETVRTALIGRDVETVRTALWRQS